MGRSKRGRKLKRAAGDDQDIDENETPDPESEEFFHDDVDKFNLNREKILLDAEADDSDAEDSIDDEDIMGLELPDSADEDEEDENEDDDSDKEDKLPDDKSWGKKKASYYSADTAEQDVDHLGSDDEAWEMEKEEELEALALQKRMAAGLDEEDFDTADFEIPQTDDTDEKPEEDEEASKTVIMDLTKLSKEQKLEILFQDSPELFELLDEFKAKLEELVSKICPLMKLSKNGKLPLEGSKYIELKHQLLLNYCINIGFYLLLKSKQTSVKDHPVIERIVQFRTFIKDLEPLDNKLEDDMNYLLDNKDSMLLDSANANSNSETKPRKVIKKTNVEKKKPAKKSKSKLSALLDDSDEEEQEDYQEPPQKRPKKSKVDKDEIDPLEYYEKIKAEKKKAKQMKDLAARLAHEPEINLDDLDINEEGKRAITYQISKNKGLTARKKKEYRNPRVKHRKKYSKAVIKRKSQVRPVVTEMSRYDGEKSGIRAFLTRSTKIK